MPIHIAKTAGFCFGVNRAVEMVTELAEAGGKVFTLGSIIHNAFVAEDLGRKGVRIVDSPLAADRDGILVIRSHGVPKAVYDQLDELDIKYIDATCPFVSKIHKIVCDASINGDTVLIAGDADHPEVLGTSGHCVGDYYVFRDEDELASLIDNHPDFVTKSITVVSQTTFHANVWQKCEQIIKKVCTNSKIFGTICNATMQRQSEAVELSKLCDRMIVIGDRHSSNTAKLFQICSCNCEAYRVESSADLSPEMVRGASHIGITAGASTPAGIIKEVFCFMADIMNNEENFAELYAESEKSANMNGKVVHGTVVGIAPNEIYVDVGRKQSGIVVLEELTDDPNKTTAELVKVGEELDLMILKTNDQEGYIYLSRRHLDAVRAWSELVEASPKIVSRSRRRDDDDEVITAADDDAAAVEEAKDAAVAPEAVAAPAEAVESGEPAPSAEVPAEAATEQAPAEPQVKKEAVIFEGIVTKVVKGGVIVSYKGVEVFVPASQATARRNDPLDDLLKKTVRFTVIEVDTHPRHRRAVGSMRDLLYKERREKESAFWDTIDVGATYTGKVKSMTDYGVFVELGPVDGMVHISELSWTRIKHPSEVLNIGDVVEVFVKKVDKEKGKISLGYKKTEDNPWEILKVTYPVGTIVEAPIVGTTAFGAFARILPGIDGLIHISQLAATRVAVPADVVAVGDVVRAVITEIDFDRHRVSMSIRALLDPVEELPAEEPDDAPAEEAVAEDSTVEETPAVEEAPAVEEIPADEVPAEEEQQPVDETIEAGAEE